LSSGPLPSAGKILSIAVLSKLLQAKLYDRWDAHLGQLLAEVVASREEYVLNELAPAMDATQPLPSGKKRKMSDDDVQQKMSQVRMWTACAILSSYGC
jgi:hypothetical protein